MGLIACEMESTPFRYEPKLESEAAPPATGIAAITGKDFIGESFGREFMIAPTVLSLKHFGAAQANVDLKSHATRLSYLLKTRTSENVFPKVNVRLVNNASTSSTILNEALIPGALRATAKVDAPSGRYRIVVSYSSSTDASKRPPVDIHWFVFE